MKSYTHESVLASSPLRLKADKQIAFEQEAQAKARSRYWQKADETVQKGEGGRLNASGRLLSHWVPDLAVWIGNTIKHVKGGGTDKNAGTVANVLVFASNPNPNSLAAITLEHMVSRMLHRPDGVANTGMCEGIGRDIADEMAIVRTRNNREKFSYTRKDGKVVTTGVIRALRLRLGDENIKRSSVRKWLKAHALLHPDEYRKSACIQIGMWLAEAALKACMLPDKDGKPVPAFIRQHVRLPKRRLTILWKMTDEARSALMDGHNYLQLARPLFYPMIFPPEDRKPDGTGGYLTIKSPFIIRPSHDQRAWLKTTPADSPWFKAANIQQQTAWRIHPEVLRVAKHFYDRGGGRGMITWTPKPRPASPDGYDPNAPYALRWATVDPAIKKAYKKEAYAVRKANIELASQAASLAEIMERAASMAKHERFFQPIRVDRRMRFYPAPVHLNNQGWDLPRGLMEFADPTPLGNSGNFWLRVHVASRWGHGVDKLAFWKRLKWVEENRDMINRITNDPIANTEWLEADGEPYGFLAACFALVDSDHGMRCPVQLDGTCSGVQHLACMTRDRVSAALVNLTEPENKDADPSSVYAFVAKNAAYGNEPEMEKHLDAKLAKGKVMTTFYGSKPGRQGRKIWEILEGRGVPTNTAKGWAGIINVRLTASLESTCPGPIAMLHWLQRCADIHSDAGKAVRVVGPNGWHFDQHTHKYLNSKSMVIETMARKVKVKLAREGDKPRRDKQRNGIAANVTHLYDAAHAAESIIRMEGGPIGYVHDCAQNPAGRCSQFLQVNAEAMIHTHRTPATTMLFDQWREAGVDVPEPPPPGNFNIEDIRKSQYSYC